VKLTNEEDPEEVDAEPEVAVEEDPEEVDVEPEVAVDVKELDSIPGCSTDLSAETTAESAPDPMSRSPEPPFVSPCWNAIVMLFIAFVFTLTANIVVAATMKDSAT
jgi:hypothetical protein